ncbi:MAG: asparagine synthase-related protein [Phenylobacterium sp.]|uniref:asparagine synthase-related protein n=1 Tax=Phenylobacterium sp. TaxID=1871053 RepID=UPI00391C48D5
MRRTSFFAIAARRDSLASPGLDAEQLAEIEHAGDWRCAVRLPGLAVWSEPSGALPVRALPRGSGVLIGEVLPRAAAAPSPWAAPHVDWENPRAAAGHLCAGAWGAYVALLRDPRARLALFREPTGQLPAFAWTLRSGERVVASDPRRVPAALSPPDLGIHWERVWRFTAQPGAASDRPLLDGLQGACPGQLLWLDEQDAAPETVWTPADFIPRGGRMPDEAAETIVARVDQAVAGRLRHHDRVLVEVSGGLDSAIVAGAIAAAGLTRRVAAWLNIVGGEREADEARYADAVVRRVGAALHRIERRARRLDVDEIEAAAFEPWPTMAAIEPDRDRIEAELARSLGATAIVSGQGGDAAFFQMPGAAIFADALRDRGLRALNSPLLANVARRTRRSVWGVLAEVAPDKRRTAPARRSPYVLAPPGEAEHPWVRAAREADAPPGKRLQILALAALHLHQADSRRRAVADIVFPLFSQPLIEHALAIPSYVLAGAAYDRPFARQAFAARLPSEVLARRGKGDHTVHYAHVVARSLDVIRPYLLDGSLCRAGVLDRAALERALRPERLIWEEQPGAILWATAVEAWVRTWQRQVPDARTAPRRPGRDARRGS